jgi:transcription initiation factor IIE alpha subunit
MGNAEDDNGRETLVNPIDAESTTGTQYYKCVDCGNYGKFGRKRFRGLNCEKCNEDLLTPYDMEEIQESEHLTRMFKEVM